MAVSWWIVAFLPSVSALKFTIYNVCHSDSCPTLCTSSIFMYTEPKV